MTPVRLTRPNVGMSPTTPQSDAGPRIDPPVSEPSATGTRPAATAAPEPVEEPPVKCARFQGLRAGGHGRSDRKSTRLNSSHSQISYAVFCLRKKKRRRV